MRHAEKKVAPCEFLPRHHHEELDPTHRRIIIWKLWETNTYEKCQTGWEPKNKLNGRTSVGQWQSQTLWFHTVNTITDTTCINAKVSYTYIDPFLPLSWSNQIGKLKKAKMKMKIDIWEKGEQHKLSHFHVVAVLLGKSFFISSSLFFLFFFFFFGWAVSHKTRPRISCGLPLEPVLKMPRE